MFKFKRKKSKTEENQVEVTSIDYLIRLEQKRWLKAKLYKSRGVLYEID